MHFFSSDEQQSYIMQPFQLTAFITSHCGFPCLKHLHGRVAQLFILEHVAEKKLIYLSICYYIE